MILKPLSGAFVFFIAFYRNIKAQKKPLMILKPLSGALVFI
jgi:hypothetical protein